MSSVARLVPLDPRAVPAALFFLALLAVGVANDEAFASSFNIASILTQATPLLLVAIGQTFAIGVRGLDLSAGATVSLSAALVATSWEAIGPAAVPLGMVAALAVGVANGVGVAAGLNPFLTTLAALSVVQGIVFTFRPSPGGRVPASFGELAGYWGAVPRALPLALGVALTAAFVLRRTRLGAHLLAVGGDQGVARLAGIPVARTRVAAFALCGGLAGLAGVFVAARTRTGDPLIGQSFTLDSLAAVVLGGSLLAGGRVTVLGTVFGTLALSLLPKVLNFSGVPTYYQLPLKGLLLILAVGVPAVIVQLRERRRAHRAAVVARTAIGI